MSTYPGMHTSIATTGRILPPRLQSKNKRDVNDDASIGNPDWSHLQPSEYPPGTKICLGIPTSTTEY
eukprot:3687963-Rhodomonas_salina.1